VGHVKRRHVARDGGAVEKNDLLDWLIH
jgi:hypothetical protein